MKLLVYLSFVVTLFAATCSAVTFERGARLFAVPRYVCSHRCCAGNPDTIELVLTPFLNSTHDRGGSNKESEGEKRVDDYEAAEKRIFQAEKHAVEVVEKAIEDEVGTLYREMPHHKKEEESLTEKKKKVVKVAKR